MIPAAGFSSETTKFTKPVFCVVGPTACGKTQLAFKIAEHFPIEIISVDSALIYRDMDIGTAKPNLLQRERIRHHLIDTLDPTQIYSAGQFRQDALTLISEIQKRNHIPLLVGGTMLYYKVLIHGIATVPNADYAIRQNINKKAFGIGWSALHQQLAEIDPLSAQKIKPFDRQRIQRALEIFELTGKTLSQYHRQHQQQYKQQSPYSFIMLSLEPSQRAVLHQNIVHRFHSMLKQGLIDEVQALQKKYTELHAELPSMRCVGYRQVWAYLEGKINDEALRNQGVFATRQLAKRQLTWLKQFERQVLDCSQTDVFDKGLALFTQLIEKQPPL